jgi:adenylate kinase
MYKEQAAPVEEFFQKRGVLLDFEITGGIPETLPRLLDAVRPHIGNWDIADIHE